MRVRPILAALFVLGAPASASGQLVVGYQLGLTQSVGTTIGDDLNTLTFLAGQNQGNVQDDNPNGQPGQVDDFQTAGLDVTSLQGVQLNTQFTGNLTLDWVTRTFRHALVLGSAVGQLVPVGVPDSEIEQAGQTVDLNAQLRERITTLQASATYLTTLQQPRWSLAFGANYVFGLNGRLDNGANGGVAAAGGGVGTLPAASAGAFAFNGVTHTAGALTELRLTRSRWDLALGATYNYANNGVYTLAAGALGGQGAANAATTNLGAFIPTNLHTLTPTLVVRARAGRRGLVTVDANSTFTTADEIRDDVVVLPDGTTQITRAPVPPPETIINTARVEYAYQAGRERSLGADVTGTFSFRVATDAQGVPLIGSALGADTLIYTARAFYRDLLPWETRIDLSVGAAQANLFQAPFGAAVDDPDAFESIRSSWEPVAQLTLQRRFDPVDVTLTGQRDVAVGALGASAIVTEGGALTFQHVADFGERRLVSNLGFNANRTRGVGRDLFDIPNPNDPAVVAFNNYGAGVTAALAMPIWVQGPFALDATATYNFNYVVTTPDFEEGDAGFIPPIVTHVGLFTLRAVYGRGTANNAAGVGGRVASDELDAFSADPANGSPLLTQRLLQQGAPLGERGNRPGQAPSGRRDSRQAYQQSIRQQRIEREARERAGALSGQGTVQQEEEEALEREKAEQKRREEERTRDFGGWPGESVPLPDAPPPDSPK